MPPRPAGERLQRLLAVMPWLAARGSATLGEIAARFGGTPAEIRSDLELAACCGLPPYSPDQLIELIVDDDVVEAIVPHYFRRPLQLSGGEGLALLTAGQALLAVKGSDPTGPLATALAKLESALGGPGIAVELEQPEHLAEVSRAVDEHRRIEVRYYSPGRDALTDRVVDPMAVRAAGGHWYLAGWCHTADGWRLFRVDRMQAVTLTDERFEPRGDMPDDVLDPEHLGDALPPVVLAVPPRGRWVAQTYPTSSTRELDDGWLEVTLPLAGRAWLDQVLLRVGAEARVVSPPDLVDAGRAAAARVLQRYKD